MHNDKSTDVTSKTTLKQGCVLTILLFSIVANEAVKKGKDWCKKIKIGPWKMRRIQLQEKLSADDIDNGGLWRQPTIQLKRIPKGIETKKHGGKHKQKQDDSNGQQRK